MIVAALPLRGAQLRKSLAQGSARALRWRVFFDRRRAAGNLFFMSETPGGQIR
jgi:hypothetical protein